MTEWGAMIGTVVGPMYVSVDSSGAVTGCGFGRLPDAIAMSEGRCNAALEQLDQYFAGRRMEFDVPLALSGTDFQRSVWKALLHVPYGETVSYRHLAAVIGRPRAVRAVGQANGANPIAVMIPCHRVIGTNGRLVGYGGGMAAKEILLALERRVRAMGEEAALFPLLW